MTALELDDIQGNVLRAYGLPFGCHLFVRIDNGTGGRAWLTEAAARVTSAAAQARSDLRVATNIAISASGLEHLDVPPGLRAEFSPEFQAGMTGRSEELGDRGAAHPEHWEEPVFSSRSADLVLSVYAVNSWRLEREVEAAKAQLSGFDLKVLHERPVARVGQGTEHFGFADGFAQPRIEGAPTRSRPHGTSSAWTRPLPAGEFLLGYRDLDGAFPDGPPGALGRNGTYMVYREFYQDVAAFRRFLRDQSAVLGMDQQRLAAKIVGRWPNGTPLVVSPDHDRLARGLGDPRLDDFGYAGDPDGFRCPLGAHIRRANPRDEPRLGAELTRRHRMIRRGMPYGPPLRSGVLDDDGEKRGLAFVCFVASISRQFEVVFGQWGNDGNAFGLGAEPDFLMAADARPTRMTLQGTPPVFVTRPRGVTPFVRTRGGEYFYLPGIAGLRSLAEGLTYG